MKKNLFLSLVAAALFLGGCSTKEAEYNKPASYWYNQIVKEIGNHALDKADDYFSSLQSEHINSIFIPEAMMMLVQAHMQEEEYILATYYLDEYSKRFAEKEERDYVEYLKIKAKFLAFKHPNRNQELLNDTLSSVNSFIQMYPDSTFIPYVQTMQTRLMYAQYLLNHTIVELYNKLDKPEAAKYYASKVDQEWIKEDEIEPVDRSWIRSLFE